MSPDAVSQPPPQVRSLDWELDFYSRPIQDEQGRKRWELLVCSTPSLEMESMFRFVSRCPADSVNSLWLQQALGEALAESQEQGFPRPRRIRSWRSSTRTMVQRSAQALGLELVPSRRCYALTDWLRQREEGVYPQEHGFLAGPLAPQPATARSVAMPLPEAARGQRWQWVNLPVTTLREAWNWDVGFASLLPVPSHLNGDISVPGIQIIGAERALATAGWLAGLEPVQLMIDQGQLILEAGLEDRWRFSALSSGEADAAQAALARGRAEVGGLQFIAVQAGVGEERLAGFWMLQDRPDL